MRCMSVDTTKPQAMSGKEPYVLDPYARCEYNGGEHCRHDVSRGITIAELLGKDGPYPTLSHLDGRPMPVGPIATFRNRLAEHLRGITDDERGT